MWGGVRGILKESIIMILHDRGCIGNYDEPHASQCCITVFIWVWKSLAWNVSGHVAESAIHTSPPPLYFIFLSVSISGLSLLVSLFWSTPKPDVGPKKMLNQACVSCLMQGRTTVGGAGARVRRGRFLNAVKYTKLSLWLNLVHSKSTICGCECMSP